MCSICCSQYVKATLNFVKLEQFVTCKHGAEVVYVKLCKLCFEE